MTSTRTRTIRLLAPLGGALVAAALLAGCSGGSTGGGSDSAVSSSDSGAVGAAEPAAAAADRAGGDTSAEQVARRVISRAVISTGSVELVADDVPDARLDVLRVVARYGGQVTDEQTATDPDTPVSSDGSTGSGSLGAPEDTAASPTVTHTHLVVRVPSARFTAALRDLSAVGVFVASSQQSSDVTTRVIDTRARLRVQARSVDRIAALLDRATDIKDIVAIEAQLSRRQADLESLRQQAAYLDDQTSLSTITVDLERRTAAQRNAERSAFVAGLVSGWHAFTGVLGGLLTALGALLPFLVVLLPLALAVRLLRRRSRPVLRDEPAPDAG